MAQASFPFEGIDTTETQFSKWARNFNNGVDDEPTGPALQVSAGSGLAVDVAVGEAMVRGHYYINDAVETLTLATADPTDDRIDLVVLKLDPTANSITLAVKTGTPAGSPSAPSLVQTDAGIYEQPLAEVEVAAASGVPGTITDRREFMGTRLGSWSTAGRPTPAGRVLFGFNTDTGTIEFYNTGTSAWEDVTPASIDDIGDVTITSVSDGDLLAYDSGTSEWVNQALESAQLPAGSVLQVVQGSHSTQETTTSTSYSDTSLTASITPKSDSSTIYIFVVIPHRKYRASSTNTGTGYYLVQRGGTVVVPETYSLAVGQAGSGNIDTAGTVSLVSTDTPATTSSITYVLRHKVNNGELNTFIGGNTGTMTLIEVAA